MKREKLIEYHSRFQIGGLLAPGLGGPYGFVSHSLKPGEDYFKVIAKEIKFIAVRPFESLNIHEKSDWTLDESVKEMFTGELEPVYMKWSCFIPRFTGKGSLFILVGDHEFGKLGTRQRLDAHFTATKSGISTEQLLRIIRDLYAGTCHGEMGTFWCNIPVRAWRLKFVLKRTWDAANPARSSYEIFMPPADWIRKHATYATAYARTLV